MSLLIGGLFEGFPALIAPASLKEPCCIPVGIAPDCFPALIAPASLKAPAGQERWECTAMFSGVNCAGLIEGTAPTFQRGTPTSRFPALIAPASLKGSFFGRGI